MHGKVLPLKCCPSFIRVHDSMSFKTDNPLCKNIAICWISKFGMNHKLFRLGSPMKVQLLFQRLLHPNRMEKGWFVYTWSLNNCFCKVENIPRQLFFHWCPSTPGSATQTKYSPQYENHPVEQMTTPWQDGQKRLKSTKQQVPNPLLKNPASKSFFMREQNHYHMVNTP